MTNDTPKPRNPFADISPALADYTDNVLYGDLWKRSQLSARDRSLVTVSCLVALYRINEMPFHLKRALENGLTPRRAHRGDYPPCVLCRVAHSEHGAADRQAGVRGCECLNGADQGLCKIGTHIPAARP